MVIFTQDVLNTFLSGTQPVYTDTQFADLLGSVERLSIFGIEQSVSGTSPTLTIQIEHSPDGARWQNQAGSPELNAAPMSSGGIVSIDSANNVPMANYVRLRITLGGTSPTVHLRLRCVGISPGGS